MILLDLNQVMIANLMVQLSRSGQEADEGLLRHMILNSIRMNNMKFKSKYGELVICCDDTNNWRKDFFPYYKAHRKKSRDESTIDWSSIFQILNKIREELKENFPYKVIRVDRAEADDVISALTHKFGVYLQNEGSERILILSGDKDFGQLQKFVNVDQYNPVMKKWIRVSDAEAFLKEHIIRGDVGDGVPNILSNDNCLAAQERQKSIYSKKLNDWLKKDPEEFCENEVVLRNYMRNKKLVDLTEVPDRIVQEVINIFEKYETPSRRGLLNYFIKNKLKLLIEHVGEF